MIDLQEIIENISYEKVLTQVDPSLPFLDVFPVAERRKWEHVWEKALRIFGGPNEMFPDPIRSDVCRIFPHLWSWNLTTGLITLVPNLIEYLTYSAEETGLDFDGWSRWVHPSDLDKVLKARSARLNGSADLFCLRLKLRMKGGRWCTVTACEVDAEIGPNGMLTGLMGVFLPGPCDLKPEPEHSRAAKETMVPIFYPWTSVVSTSGGERRIDRDKTPGLCISLHDIPAYNLGHFLDFIEGSNEHMVFRMDTHLKYNYMNESLRDHLGLSLAQLLGSSDVDLFGALSDSRLELACSCALRGTVCLAEFNWPVDGVLRSFRGLIVAHRHPRGEPIYIFGVCDEVGSRIQEPETIERDFLGFKSAEYQNTMAVARGFAENEDLVLLVGESGCGKDWLARYIHDHSPRSGRPFFVINCPGINKEMAESELFGHERGAFTGAEGLKRGLLELAENGTLLLNEIGDLSVEIQAKLLTFLDTLSFNRVGGQEPVQVNARLIAATNRDLEKAVSEGSFRKDLFYRLNVLRVQVPPLRKRTEDIELLSKRFVEKLVARFGYSEIPALSPGALRKLKAYYWPGNVRQLENTLKRAIVLSKGGPITPDLLEFPDEKTGDSGTDDRVFKVDTDRSHPVRQTWEHEGVIDMDPARIIFHGLSPEDQGYYLDIMVNKVCGGKSGAVKVVAELLKMNRKTVKNKLKLVTDKKTTSGNPGLAEDWMRREVTKYLIDTILKQAR